MVIAETGSETWSVLFKTDHSILELPNHRFLCQSKHWANFLFDSLQGTTKTTMVMHKTFYSILTIVYWISRPSSTRITTRSQAGKTVAMARFFFGEVPLRCFVLVIAIVVWIQSMMVGSSIWMTFIMIGGNALNLMTLRSRGGYGCQYYQENDQTIIQPLTHVNDGEQVVIGCHHGELWWMRLFQYCWMDSLVEHSATLWLLWSSSRSYLLLSGYPIEKTHPYQRLSRLVLQSGFTMAQI